MTDIEVGPFRGTVVRWRDEAGQDQEFLKVVHCWAPLVQIALLPLEGREIQSVLFLWFAAAGRCRDLMEDLEVLARHPVTFFGPDIAPNYEGYVYDIDDDDDEEEEETDWRENYEQDEQIVSGFMDYLKNRPKPAGGD